MKDIWLILHFDLVHLYQQESEQWQFHQCTIAALPYLVTLLHSERPKLYLTALSKAKTTLLHSERPKLNRVLAFPSAIGLKDGTFSFQKQPQKAKSVLQNGSRLLGLFRKRKPHLIAELCKTILHIVVSSGMGPTLTASKYFNYPKHWMAHIYWTCANILHLRLILFFWG